MPTLKEKIKNLSLGAKAGLVGLGLATLVGTFGGNEGGLAPFYNKKVGTWGGINLGVYTEFKPESKFYGLSVSLFQGPEKIKENVYAKNYFYGVQVGVGNGSENLNGIQVGGLNGSENLNGVQVGVANKNQKGWSVLLNFGDEAQK